MSTTATISSQVCLDQIQSLRTALPEVTSREDWQDKMPPWIEEARPVIGRCYPDQLAAFDNATKNPEWTALCISASADWSDSFRSPFLREEARERYLDDERSDERRNRALTLAANADDSKCARSARTRIDGFLKGILRVEGVGLPVPQNPSSVQMTGGVLINSSTFQGNPILAASISDSFNKVESSTARPERKEQIEALRDLIQELAMQVPDDAPEVAECYETVVQEVVSPKPKRWKVLPALERLLELGSKAADLGIRLGPVVDRIKHYLPPAV